MTSPLRYLSSLLFSLSLTASAQTFSPGDYQINRRRDSPTAGFEVAELLAGSNITFTWDNTNKTVTIAGSAGGAATWGTITGTLSAQTDLQTALDAKQATGNYLTALTGDVTATGPGSVAATIANDAVTYAKMQNVSAAARLLGRGPSSGAGDVQEITIGAGLGWTGNELRATGINPFDQDLNTTDPVTFPGITLTNGTIATGTNFLDYTHVGTQGDVPELIVRLNDGTTDIGYTLLGFRGDGAGSGASYLQGSNADFRIEQTGGTLANVFGLTFTGTGSNLTALNASNITTGTLATARLPTVPVANGGTGLTTLTANAVLLGNGTSAFQTVAPSTTGNVLTSNGTTWTSAAPAASGTKTIRQLTPRDNQPPSSAFATLDTRNSIAVLDFDTATEEAAIFVGVIPEGATLTSGITVRITWTAATATSGDCRWGAQWMRCNTDLDSDSFDTATEATTTTNGTSGIPNTTSITCTAIDSVAAGETYRLRIYRDTGDAADTMAGDAELLTVEVRTAN